MPKAKSVALDPSLVAKATEQTNALKVTLEQIADTTSRSTSGVRTLSKNGRPLAKIARSAAIAYPEVLTGRFDKEEFDFKMSFDEQTENLISLINDTVDTFVKVRSGNSADIEYFKRKVYAALSEASKEESKYTYYAEQLAAEYEGQGKKSGKDDGKDDHKPSADK